MNSHAITDDDVKAIKDLGEEFFAGVNAGDLDRRMATMAPDVIIMPSDRPAIIGKEEIRRLSLEYSATYEEKVSVVIDEVVTAGNLGFVRATVTGIRTSKASSAADELSLNNLWIVKKQADRKWTFWRIMFNHAFPPQRI